MKNFKFPKLVFALSCLAFLLSGCGGGNAQKSDNDPGVIGYAVDDYILGGRLALVSLQTGTVAYESRTGDFGRFVLPSSLQPGFYRVQIAGGVEDADGLGATRADQRPFTDELTALIEIGSSKDPIVVNAISTGIERYSGSDVALYKATMANLPESLKMIAAINPALQLKEALSRILDVQRVLGHNNLVDELSDDGLVNQSKVDISAAQISNVIANIFDASNALRMIPDSGLRECIADSLGKEASQVAVADLDLLKRLNCSGYEIHSLDAIATAVPRLEYFHAENNGISSVEPLSNLNSLVFANLRNNIIQTLEPLRRRSSPMISMMIAENCINQPRELNDDSRLQFSSSDLRAKRQFSNCEKNDAEVLAYSLRKRSDGKFLLTYRTTYNPFATCRIDWGDGSGTPVVCDGRTGFLVHDFASPAGKIVAFIVNDEVKREAITEGVGSPPRVVDIVFTQASGLQPATLRVTFDLDMNGSYSTSGAYTPRQGREGNWLDLRTFEVQFDQYTQGGTILLSASGFRSVGGVPMIEDQPFVFPSSSKLVGASAYGSDSSGCNNSVVYPSAAMNDGDLRTSVEIASYAGCIGFVADEPIVLSMLRFFPAMNNWSQYPAPVDNSGDVLLEILTSPDPQGAEGSWVSRGGIRSIRLTDAAPVEILFDTLIESVRNVRFVFHSSPAAIGFYEVEGY